MLLLLFQPAGPRPDSSCKSGPAPDVTAQDLFRGRKKGTFCSFPSETARHESTLCWIEEACFLSAGSASAAAGQPLSVDPPTQEQTSFQAVILPGAAHAATHTQ